MKNLILLTSLLLGLAGTSVAEETLLNGHITHGGYFAPTAVFTEFNGEFGVLAGGQGGWILNHTFMIGGAGYGLATNHNPQSVPAGFPWSPGDTRTQFGYGGVMLSYIGSSDHLVHPVVNVLIGGGAINGDRKSSSEWLEDDANYDPANSDRFFVVEPSVSGEMNLANFMRLQLGAGYRIVSGIEKWGYTNDDVSGVTASASLKIGKF